MNIQDLHIGQVVETEYWYTDKDGWKEYAYVRGAITCIIECYNSVCIDIAEVLCGYCSKSNISVSIDQLQ